RLLLISRLIHVQLFPFEKNGHADRLILLQILFSSQITFIYIVFLSVIRAFICYLLLCTELVEKSNDCSFLGLKQSINFCIGIVKTVIISTNGYFPIFFYGNSVQWQKKRDRPSLSL